MTHPLSWQGPARRSTWSPCYLPRRPPRSVPHTWFLRRDHPNLPAARSPDRRGRNHLVAHRHPRRVRSNLWPRRSCSSRWTPPNRPTGFPRGSLWPLPVPFSLADWTAIDGIVRVDPVVGHDLCSDLRRLETVTRTAAPESAAIAVRSHTLVCMDSSAWLQGPSTWGGSDLCVGSIPVTTRSMASPTWTLAGTTGDTEVQFAVAAAAARNAMGFAKVGDSYLLRGRGFATLLVGHRESHLVGAGSSNSWITWRPTPVMSSPNLHWYVNPATL